MKKWTALLLLAVMTLNGCFSFVPAGASGPTSGARVRVYLSQPQEVRLSQISVNDVAMIDGELIGADEQEVRVSAIWLTARNGFETPGESATVRVPRGSVLRTEVRRPSVLKSAAIVGAAAVLAALFASATVNGTDDGGNNGGGEQ